LLVANSNGHIYQYIGKNGKEIFHTSENDNYILTVDYKNDGSTFATGGKDNIIRLYN
jgi:WD40 repeat protein